MVQGHPLLSGETTATASTKTPACVSATVDPHTLHVAPGAATNCNDPAVDGQSVGVVNRSIPDSNDATISIAHRDRETGRTSVGPVVMTYGTFSDTRPVMAYGGGWLWIMTTPPSAPALTGSVVSIAGVAEVLQVSASTGRVIDTVPPPVSTNLS